MNFRIDPDFLRISQLWPLTSEERANLKASIEADGVREPGTVWDGMLLDGHNRFEICKELGKAFPTVNRKFDSRDDAMLWVLSIDESRRNLQPIDKVARAEFKRPILERKAGERMTAGVANPTEILPEGVGEVREQLAEEVGVSGKTYDALRTVINEGSPELVQAVRNKETSATAAAKLVKTHDQQQQSQVIKAAKESGESVRKAVVKAVRPAVVEQPEEEADDAETSRDQLRRLINAESEKTVIARMLFDSCSENQRAQISVHWSDWWKDTD